VLGFIVLMAFIVVAFMQDATSRIRYYGLFHNRDDLRVYAYSGLEISLAVINQFREIDQGLWGPAQGWNDPLAFAGISFAEDNVSVTATVRDESGKFPLKDIDDELLRRIFETLGFDLARAEELTDALLDWMDEDDLRRLNGYDGEDYERDDLPHRARNRMIASWDELELIHGFREAFWDEDGRPLPELAQLRSILSLKSPGPININAASPLVLAVLGELGAVNPDFIDDYRNGIDGVAGTADDRIIREKSDAMFSGESANIGTEAAVLEVTVEARRGEAVFMVSALVSWSGSNPTAGLQTSGPDNTGDEPDDTPEPPADGDPANGSQRPAPRRLGDTSINPRNTAGSASQLGYPFKIISLTENRKI